MKRTVIEMKLCYNEATMMRASSLERDLELCEKAGFDFIEIRFDMLHDYLKTHTAEDLRNFFASAHIKPHAVNGVYLKSEVNLADPKQREEYEKEIRDNCKDVVSVGAEYFILVPPLNHDRITPWSEPRETSDPKIIKMSRFVCEIAAEYGLKACFELVGAPYSSCRSIDHARDIVNAVNLDNLGYVFDTYNIYLNRCCTEYEKMASVGLEKVFAIHINDAIEVPVDELGPQANRRLCGEGVLPVRDYLKAVKAMGYEGMVSIETFFPGYYEKDPAEVIPYAYESTRKVMEECGCL